MGKDDTLEKRLWLSCFVKGKSLCTRGATGGRSECLGGAAGRGRSEKERTRWLGWKMCSGMWGSAGGAGRAQRRKDPVSATAHANLPPE